MSRTYDLLDPKNDAVFKMMLTRPGSKPALIGLLNAALQPKVPIIDLEVINPNVPIEVIGDKGTILDIHAELADGTRIDIEMQMRSYQYLGRRADRRRNPLLKDATVNAIRLGWHDKGSYA